MPYKNLVLYWFLWFRTWNDVNFRFHLTAFGRFLFIFNNLYMFWFLHWDRLLSLTILNLLFLIFYLFWVSFCLIIMLFLDDFWDFSSSWKRLLSFSFFQSIFSNFLFIKAIFKSIICDKVLENLNVQDIIIFLWELLQNDVESSFLMLMKSRYGSDFLLFWNINEFVGRRPLLLWRFIFKLGLIVFFKCIIK